MIDFKSLGIFLKEHNNYVILTHSNPDGDTLGSGFSLCLALRQIGKNAEVITTGVTEKFSYLQKGISKQNFVPETVVSTDVASENLLGENMRRFIGRIDVCIDHHKTNSIDAKQKFVDPRAGANCEILYKLFVEMGIDITVEIADCLYTGISTDTGCFRYTNTTSETMRIAASLMDSGCHAEYINKAMFETKSRARIMVEQAVCTTMTFCADDRCAIAAATLETARKFNACDDDIEGISSIPRQIEGVVMGITMKEKEGGFFKISVRTNGNTNAADFCAKFGGGGHFAAAGCKIYGTLDEVRSKLIAAAESFLK